MAAAGTGLTLIAYSAMVPLCLAVRKAFAARNLHLEVVDLVSLQPLDRETIVKSVRKTGRAVIVEEGCLTGGVGAEVAAVIAGECMDALEAPVRRVAAADVPIPSSPELEKAVLPGPDDVVKAVREVLSW